MNGVLSRVVLELDAGCDDARVKTELGALVAEEHRDKKGVIDAVGIDRGEDMVFGGVNGDGGAKVGEKTVKGGGGFVLRASSPRNVKSDALELGATVEGVGE